MYELKFYYTNDELGRNNCKSVTFSEYASNSKDLKRIINKEKEALELNNEQNNLKVIYCDVLKFEREIIF